jgi:hypothetical protein
LGESAVAEILEDDGEEAPSGEGGGGVFGGDDGLVFVIGSGSGHRSLRDDRRGEE